MNIETLIQRAEEAGFCTWRSANSQYVAIPKTGTWWPCSYVTLAGTGGRAVLVFTEPDTPTRIRALLDPTMTPAEVRDMLDN